jgi:hypothetical protein
MNQDLPTNTQKQPPSPAQSAPNPATATLTTADNVVFGVLFTIEVLFFVIYSGCSVFFAIGFGFPNPFLLLVPVLLACHIIAYKSHRRIAQTKAPKTAKYWMYFWLLLPFIVVLGIVYLFLGLGL